MTTYKITPYVGSVMLVLYDSSNKRIAELLLWNVEDIEGTRRWANEAVRQGLLPDDVFDVCCIALDELKEKGIANYG